jgi:hypothetical protein
MYQATILTKEVAGYYGGPSCIRYFAILDDPESNEITKRRCDRLAIALLEQHAKLNNRRRERAWDLLCSAISDALWPDQSTGCDGSDQESAFAWFLSDDAMELMDTVGLEPDYFWKVISRLSKPDGEADE